MTFDEVVAKIAGAGQCSDSRTLIQRTLEAVGIHLADDGTLLDRKSGAPWSPIELARPRRTYKNGRGVRK